MSKSAFGFSGGWFGWVRRVPGPAWDALVFALVAAAAVHARWTLWGVMPTYLWSNDSMSYLSPALEFVESGRFEGGTRRGFTYPMLIAAVLKAGGNLNTLVFVQHALGVLSVLMSCAALRLWFGRAALPAVAACGVALGYFDVVVYLEHLVRNEALIHFFMAAGVVAFCGAMRHGCRVAAAVSGAALALAQVTKGILGPFPLFAAGALAWRRRDSWRAAAALAGAFLAVFAGGIALPRCLTWAGVGNFTSEAYAGIQFYGRVAQWTVLDGGIYPELKAAIRPAVETYQAKAKEKLDNNLVIKRLIVPVAEDFLAAHPGAYPPVDRVCRDLAFEAVRRNPWGFARQAWAEGRQLLSKTAFRKRMPSEGDIADLIGEMEGCANAPAVMKSAETAGLLRVHGTAENLARFHALGAAGWLFRMCPPLAAASVAILVLLAAGRRETRALWLALGAYWFFSVVLLSTVGRPLNRYAVPLAPTMFLALAWPFAVVCVRGPEWLAAARAGTGALRRQSSV